MQNLEEQGNITIMKALLVETDYITERKWLEGEEQLSCKYIWGAGLRVIFQDLTILRTKLKGQIVQRQDHEI